MTREDQFDGLAPFYDPIMQTVDYDRWLVVAGAAADLVSASTRPIRHVDVACGTCALTKRFVQYGWNTIGVDLSPYMLRAGRKGPYYPPVLAADMRALPFRERFDYATCLFDSINFLLEDGDLARTLRQVYDALRPEGIFYFDIITRRMVTEHFEGRKWTEKTGSFSTTWEGTFDRQTRIAETSIRVNSGLRHYIRERVYTLKEIERALEAAGFKVLGAFDAENWKTPSRKTLRIDVVAAKGADRGLERKVKALQRTVQEALA